MTSMSSPRAAKLQQVPWWTLPRSIFSGALAGFISGLVFIGLGSRLVMRLIAILNPAAEGIRTEAGNIVGAITAEGTIGLVVPIGLFGGLAIGGMWVIIREWLPDAIWPRLGVAVVVAVLAGSFNVIEADNVDFFILEMAALNVAMFMALIAMATASTVYGDRWLQNRLPTGSSLGALYVGLLALGAIMTLMALASMFFVSGAFVSHPPRIEGAFLGLTTLATLALWSTKVTRSLQSSSLERLLWVVGITGVVGLSVFGASHLGDQIDPILSQVFRGVALDR